MKRVLSGSLDVGWEGVVNPSSGYIHESIIIDKTKQPRYFQSYQYSVVVVSE